MFEMLFRDKYRDYKVYRTRRTFFTSRHVGDITGSSSPKQPRWKEAPFSDSHATFSKCKYRSYRKKQEFLLTHDRCHRANGSTNNATACGVHFISCLFNESSAYFRSLGHLLIKTRPYLSRRVFKLRSFISIC